MTRLNREESKSRTVLLLVAAAEEAFLERGYTGASVDDIAGRAGFSSGALYANFAGKQDLFFAVVANWVSDDTTQLAAIAMGAPDAVSLLTDIDNWDKRNRERLGLGSMLLNEFAARMQEKLPLRSITANGYRLAFAATSDLALQLAERFGGRPPLAQADTSVAFSALSNGLSATSWLDDPSTHDGVYAEVMGMLLGLDTNLVGTSLEPVPRVVPPGPPPQLNADPLPVGRRADTVARLIAAAEHMLRERGWGEVPVEEIAAAAGYTRRAVYTNFDGKDGLLAAVAAERLRARFGALAERFAAARDLPGLLQVATELDAERGVMSPADYAFEIDALLFAVRHDQIRMVARQLKDHAVATLAATLDRLDAAGEVRGIRDSPRTAHLILITHLGLDAIAWADPDLVPPGCLARITSVFVGAEPG